MNGNRLGFLTLLGLFGVLLLATVGCIAPAGSPTPTTWYMVITNTPPPSPTPFVPASPTPTPSPTIPPAPAPTGTPVPTPLPTTPPTKPPTAPPPPPSPTLPPPPTAVATFTPVPTTPPQDVCQGDEEMTFDPKKPGVGDKLTITVTSAKAHENVRLEGPGNPGTPDKVYKDDKTGLFVWIWRVEVKTEGRLNFTFYVGNTPCTANRPGGS